MQHSFLFAGSGGQGVMFAGQLLAYAGMAEGLHVTWIPSYGPEMRGGTAHCFVILSDKQIGSPIVAHPDVALLFNHPSLDKYESIVVESGLLAVNTSLVGRLPARDDVNILAVPATDIAEGLGSARMTNMVLLGAALSRRLVLPLYALVDALKEHLSAKRRDLLELNCEALAKGAEAAQSGILV
jgi:2-oxoglutarate ferredoxin oxidoreductase subunit gamma